MSDKIQDIIRNLEFIKDGFARKIKNEELLEPEQRFKVILRSTLASLAVIAKKQNVPALKMLADNIYENISHKPQSKWRKKLYFMIGLIITVTVSFLAGDGVDIGLGDDEQSEKNKKLKYAYIQADSAIKILKSIQK